MFAAPAGPPRLSIESRRDAGVERHLKDAKPPRRPDFDRRMQLLRAHELPIEHTSLVARYSPARAIAGVVGAGIAAVTLILSGARGFGIGYYLAAVVIAGLVLARRPILARFRTSNWLARVSGRGVYLQLRSHLNYHFPVGHRTVVFIPYTEIRSARAVRERRTLPDPESRSALNGLTQARWLIVLELVADSKALAQALRDEVSRAAPREPRFYGWTGTKYRHYPVRLAAPQRVEIEWRVTPPAESFVEALRDRVTVEATEDRTTNYLRLETLSRSEQESKLLELAASGETMAAIKLARLLYAFDLVEAKEFVSGLQGAKSAKRKGA